jgi:hypothetical protein
MNNEPPAELQGILTKLNNELRGEATAILWLQPACTLQDENWRLRLEIGSHTIKHLIPEKADWHTYYLFVVAIKHAYQTGVLDGKERALRSIEKRLEEIIR